MINRRIKKMGIITAILIAAISLIMWGDMLLEIISLHIMGCKKRKKRKILYDHEYTE